MTGQGYQPERCTCGHTTGEHVSAGTSWPHPPRYGLCLVAECRCREYTPATAEHGERSPPDPAA